MRGMKNIVKILSLIPWVYIISFYSYVARVAIDIGYLPSYNNPDPSSIYPNHRNIINYSFELSFWGSIIGLVIFVFFWRTLFAVENRKYLYTFLLGVIVIVYNLFFDPLDTWYLD